MIVARPLMSRDWTTSGVTFDPVAQRAQGHVDPGIALPVVLLGKTAGIVSGVVLAGRQATIDPHLPQEGGRETGALPLVARLDQLESEAEGVDQRDMALQVARGGKHIVADEMDVLIVDDEGGAKRGWPRQTIHRTRPYSRKNPTNPARDGGEL